MSTRGYLFAVQAADGREVCSATIEVAKVSEVTTERRPGQAAIVQAGHGTIAVGDDPGGELKLHRWPASKKLSSPVSKAVHTA